MGIKITPLPGYLENDIMNMRKIYIRYHSPG
nr:MAG TPA: hypothetical protein [Caudoviricetes sp.]